MVDIVVAKVNSSGGIQLNREAAIIDVTGAWTAPSIIREMIAPWKPNWIVMVETELFYSKWNKDNRLTGSKYHQIKYKQ